MRKVLLICLLFSFCSVFASRTYNSREEKFYIHNNKPCDIVINSNWIFGNTGYHKVATHFKVDQKIVYTADGQRGKRENYANVINRNFHLYTAGDHLLRITLHSSGGNSFVKGAFSSVTVLD